MVIITEPTKWSLHENSVYLVHITYKASHTILWIMKWERLYYEENVQLSLRFGSNQKSKCAAVYISYDCTLFLFVCLFNFSSHDFLKKSSSSCSWWETSGADCETLHPWHGTEPEEKVCVCIHSVKELKSSSSFINLRLKQQPSWEATGQQLACALHKLKQMPAVSTSDLYMM